METMHVECLEETGVKAKDRAFDPPRYHQLSRGDRTTVSRACGERWCDLGWVKDLAEEDPYPTAERKPGPHRLEVKGSKHTAKKRGG